MEVAICRTDCPSVKLCTCIHAVTCTGPLLAGRLCQSWRQSCPRKEEKGRLKDRGNSRGSVSHELPIQMEGLEKKAKGLFSWGYKLWGSCMTCKKCHPPHPRLLLHLMGWKLVAPRDDSSILPQIVSLQEAPSAVNSQKASAKWMGAWGLVDNLGMRS